VRSHICASFASVPALPQEARMALAWYVQPSRSHLSCHLSCPFNWIVHSQAMRAYNRIAQVWNIELGNLLYFLDPNAGPCGALQVIGMMLLMFVIATARSYVCITAVDEAKLLFGSTDISVWDLATQVCTAALAGPKYPVTQLCIAGDARAASW
jgi:hypothetical protein